jgi:hypothetical protein
VQFVDHRSVESSLDIAENILILMVRRGPVPEQPELKKKKKKQQPSSNLKFNKF